VAVCHSEQSEESKPKARFFAALRACKQSRSKAFLKAFVILSAAKDLVAASSITLSATRSGALWADSAQNDKLLPYSAFHTLFPRSQNGKARVSGVFCTFSPRAQNDKLLVFSVSGALWADVFVVHLYSMSGTIENVERTIQLPLFLEVL